MKYILYLTVNTVTNNIYVGIHKTLNPDVFDGYIGDMVNIYHPSTIAHPKTHFLSSVKKYGFSAFKRYTLKVLNNENEALLFESLLVDNLFVNRQDTYNMVLGGGFPVLYTVPVNQFDLDGNLLHKFNSIKSASESTNLLEVCIRTAMKTKKSYGDFFWSSDDTINISEYRCAMGKKTVYEFDINGTLLNTYISLSQAAKSIEVTVDKLKNAIGKLLAINKLYYSFNNKLILKSDPNTTVYKYALDGTYLECDTLGNYTTANAIDIVKLHKAANNGMTLKLYQWNYSYVPKMPDLTSHLSVHSKRKVCQYDLQGNVVKIWDSVKECKSVFCNAPKVLSGKISSTKGYVFKYYQ